MKAWWIIGFQHGLQVSAERCLFQTSDSKLRLAENYDEAKTELTSIEKEVVLTEARDHSVPHAQLVLTLSEKGEMWMVVEAESMLEAAVKTSGLLAQKKNGS